MKYLTLLFLLIPTISFAQKVSMIDNSEFTVTPDQPIPVTYKVSDIKGEISELQSRDSIWTQRIADDQATIAKDEDILKQGSDAGVAEAAVAEANLADAQQVTP